MSINLGTIAPGGTISGEASFTDFSGNPDLLTGSPAFSLYAVGSSSAIASVALSRVGTTNRYSFSVTDATGAGTYVIAGTSGSVTNGGSLVGLVVAQFTVGYVAANVDQWLGHTATVDANNLPNVNAADIGGTAQSSGVDVAASVGAIVEGGYMSQGIIVSGGTEADDIYMPYGVVVLSGVPWTVYLGSTTGFYYTRHATGHWAICAAGINDTSGHWWNSAITGNPPLGTYNPQNGATGNPVVAINPVPATTDQGLRIADQTTLMAAANAILAAIAALPASAAAIATAVWANGTRTLTSFGTLVADTAAAVWGYVTRTLTISGNVTVKVVSPVADNQNITIYQGDAYDTTTAQQIQFLDDGTWPVMTSGGVQLGTVEVKCIIDDGTDVQLSAVVTGTAPNQVVTVTATATETQALVATGPVEPGIPPPMWPMNIRVSMNSPTNTEIRLLISGGAVVNDPLPVVW